MEQHSGSFKTLGRLPQMLALGDAALGKGVVAVSGSASEAGDGTDTGDLVPVYS